MRKKFALKIPKLIRLPATSSLAVPSCRAKHLLAIALLAATAATVSAQVVSIDFKGGNPAIPSATGDDGGTAFLPGQGGNWNVLDVQSLSPMGSPATGLLLDGNGTAGTVSFVLNVAGSAYSFYDTVDLDNLCRDLIYLESSTSRSINWQIGGLKPSTTYNLAFYAQRQSGLFNNPGLWTIGNQSRTNYDGSSVTRGVLFGNPDASESPQSITADTNGKISGTFALYSGRGASGFSSWSGLQIIPTEKIVRPSVSAATVSPSGSVYAGTVVTMAANGFGTPPLHYQWRSDTGSGPVNIAGATNETYAFTAQDLDQGTFDLVVTSPYGAATNAPLTLIVYPASAPFLLADIAPPGASSPQGGVFTFRATYEGTLPIAYQWQLDKGQGFADVPGATNFSLRLENLQLNQAGDYKLTVTNSLGKGQETSVARLEVTTNISLSVFSGAEPGHGLDLEGNFVLAEYYGGTDAGPLQLGDTVFRFSTRVAGTGWEGNTPDFDGSKPAQNLAEICNSIVYGKNLDVIIDNLKAGVDYKLQLLFHEPYHGSAGSRIMAMNIGGIDVVTNLDLADMGAYLRHPSGVALTYNFTSDGSTLWIPISTVLDNASINGLTLENLTDKAPPVVTSPNNRAVYAGNGTQFVPFVTGASPKTFQWQVGTNGIFSNLNDSDRIQGATNATLSITGLAPSDAGTYRVIVSNDAGAVTSTPPTTLAVFPRPGRQLVNVGVRSSYSGAAVMGKLPDVWNVAPGGNTSLANLVDVTGSATPLGFRVQGVSGGGNFGDGGLPTSPENAGLLGFFDFVESGAMTVTVSGLDPSSTYDLAVFSAGNQPGQSSVLSGAIIGNNTLSTRASFVLGNNYARNQSATPDNAGNLTFQISNDPAQSPYGTFNGIQILNNQTTVRLGVQLHGGNVVLTWGQGILLEAANPGGPYTAVSGNPASPYTTAPTGQKFYRVQVSP